jgi:hypothetical protein
VTLAELVSELETILKVHPESADSKVWTHAGGLKRPLHFVHYNRKYKVPRIVLTESA